MSSFGPGERAWIDRLGNLRNVVRQEMIRRQLAHHVASGSTVLDIGCGQGTQAIELARRGCAVTAIEPSTELRTVCAEAAAVAEVDVELLAGTFDDVPALVGGRRFDAVCAHGVFMYLPDTEAAIVTMGQVMSGDGLLSFTVRNGDALAMRPGVRGDWREALSSFDDLRYVNALGVAARAEPLGEVMRILSSLRLTAHRWYGVRVLTDAVPVDQPAPVDPVELGHLLDAEEIACSRDPYRSVGSQYHVIAVNTGS